MAFAKKEHRETNGPDFSRKKQSVNGIISVIMGILAVIIFAAAGILSSKQDAENRLTYGIMGIITLLFSMTGEACAVDGLRENNSRPGFPVAGLAVNAIIIIYMVSLYLYGLVVE